MNKKLFYFIKNNITVNTSSLVPTTVRLEESTRDTIDKLCDNMVITRQEFIKTTIEISLEHVLKDDSIRKLVEEGSG